jgi:DNA-binding protein HU-beta
MNKSEFAEYIAKNYNCTKTEANRIIDIFTDAVINGVGDGNELNLVGFGSFYTNKVKARSGRNPKTGASISIPAYYQPRFSAGRKLKDACNKE